MMLKVGSRRVFLCNRESFRCIEKEINRKSYALLLLANETSEIEGALTFALVVAGAGCKEICCMGYVSAELEDALDAALELQGRLDVVTTSFSEEDEALDYFLFAAGGAESGMDLVAVIDDHVSLKRSLVSLVG